MNWRPSYQLISAIEAINSPMTAGRWLVGTGMRRAAIGETFWPGDGWRVIGNEKDTT